MSNDPVGLPATATAPSADKPSWPAVFTLPAVGDPLPFSGERYVTNIKGEIELEHLHRYLSASRLCVGKAVLDIACGEGYGSYLLAHAAASVVGVDVDADCVRHAVKHYGGPRIDYRVGSCEHIPSADAMFDVVVSFETIEHIADHDRFLDEVCRVLRPGGVLILSTPNKDCYNANAEPNPYHVREVTADQFVAMLEGRFGHVNVSRQRTMFASVIAGGPDAAFRIGHQDKHRHIAFDGRMAEPTYLLAIASDSPVEALGASVYEGPILANGLSALEGGIGERDAAIRGLRAEVDAAAAAAERVRQEAAAARAEADRHAHDSTARAAYVTALLAEVEHLKSEVYTARGEAAGRAADLDRARADHTAAAVELERARTSLTAVTADLDRARTHLSTSTVEVERARAAHAAAAQEAARHRAAAAGLEAEKTAVEAELAALQIEAAARLVALQDATDRLHGVFASRALRAVVRAKKAWTAPRRLLRLCRKAARRVWGLRPGRDPRRALIAASGVFDPAYYLRTNPDVAASGCDPLDHYCRHGEAEGRRPNSLFDPSHYQQRGR